VGEPSIHSHLLLYLLVNYWSKDSFFSPLLNHSLVSRLRFSAPWFPRSFALISHFFAVFWLVLRNSVDFFSQLGLSPSPLFALPHSLEHAIGRSANYFSQFGVDVFPYKWNSKMDQNVVDFAKDERKKGCVAQQPGNLVKILLFLLLFTSRLFL